MALNNFLEIRAEQLLLATKEFRARGASVDRCERCLLAKRVCICQWCPSLDSSCDLILLFHREELFKPTNTGRLLMDCLPGNAYGYCWSRTEPNPELIKLLSDPKRRCLIVFPFDENLPQYEGRSCFDVLPDDERKFTFVLLDGTWKQAGRMFHLSKWLEKLDCVRLPAEMERAYSVRKSHQEGYVSTLEAGVMCLMMAKEHIVAEKILDYFSIFNEHYLALRGCTQPATTLAHQRLSSQV